MMGYLSAPERLRADGVSKTATKNKRKSSHCCQSGSTLDSHTHQQSGMLPASSMRIGQYSGSCIRLDDWEKPWNNIEWKLFDDAYRPFFFLPYHPGILHWIGNNTVWLPVQVDFQRNDHNIYSLIDRTLKGKKYSSLTFKNSRP